MKIGKLAYLAFAGTVTALTNPRDVSLSADQATNAREELVLGEAVPATAEDIWAELTGESNCLGCQVRFDFLETYSDEDLVSDRDREFYWHSRHWPILETTLLSGLYRSYALLHL